MRLLYKACLPTLALALVSCGNDRGGGGGDGGKGQGGCVPGECTIVTDCSPDADVHEGEATYYDFADGSGNCGFDPSPGDLMVGAMNHDDYADSASCGACIQLTGPNGEITIRIVDQCPECPRGDVNLSPEAFAKIADLSAGRVAMTWRYVACAVEGPVVYHFKDGSNEYWTAVQIRNHRYPIAKFEYQAGDGSLRAVTRESYNYFVAPEGMGPGPYTLHLTDVNGQVIEDSGIPHVENGDSPGAGQFPSCGGS